MRKSLIITVVIVLLCLCGCEAVVTVPESPELTRASEMLLTTTAAEESTDMYEVRHDDDQQGDPVQIGNWIMVNHWGTIISNKPIRLEPSPNRNNAYRDIDPEEDWNYEGTVTTVKEYMEKHPPVLHKEKEQEPVR